MDSMIRGVPVVVRGARGRLRWTPRLLSRVLARGKKATFEVDNCLTGFVEDVRPEEFFGRIDEGRGLLRVRDWPTDAMLKDAAPELYADFVGGVLPLPFLTSPDPDAAPLNLASSLPDDAVPPDLGPKMYIAQGRETEHGDGDGDSVAKLHVDLCDAANALVYVAPGVEVGGEDEDAAGAVWDIWHRDDRRALCDQLKRDHAILARRSKTADARHPTNNCCFVATEHLRLGRLAPCWRIPQREGDVVFVPAGSPHQVRNLRTCIKVAVDFVSDAGLRQCELMAEELRRLGIELGLERDSPRLHPEDRANSDKLQVKRMVLSAAVAAAAAPA